MPERSRSALLLDGVGDWPAFPDGGLGAEDPEAPRRHERTGRPRSSAAFVERLEGQTWGERERNSFGDPRRL